jgi:hypothetical protein
MLEVDALAAVLPVGTESAQDAISVATIGKVQGNTIVLMDGRTYRKHGDVYISGDGQTYIVEASQMHADAVHRRTAQRQSAVHN